MPTRRPLASLAVLCAAALAACGSDKPSDDEIAHNCAKAVKERAEGDKSKPAACNGLGDDDYTALLVSKSMDDLGWLDDNGDFDPNRMLSDVQETP
ncbi:hypothetical protein ACFH04_12190 [Streptomyces noboritoensis]|uniref:Lipoprotein n=1 Tax=Streptomyces noboritoensis TaxID=67337 RepID=A0ABV6TF91_9ACTN